MAPPAGRFVVDDLARPMALGRAVRRIVSIAPSCTESLLAISAGARLVGVEEHSRSEALAGVPRVGGFKHTELERIVALAPDLVAAAPLPALGAVPALVAEGIPVFVTHPRTVDGIVDAMARLASVIGIAAEAADYLGGASRRSWRGPCARGAGRWSTSSTRRPVTPAGRRASWTTWSARPAASTPAGSLASSGPSCAPRT